MASIIDYNLENTSVTAHIQEVIGKKEKAQELIQALNDVTTNSDTKEIILNMGGIETINLKDIGSFFGLWFPQAKKHGIEISMNNASEQVTKKMKYLFQDTINNISDTLQSGPK